MAYTYTPGTGIGANPDYSDVKDSCTGRGYDPRVTTGTCFAYGDTNVRHEGIGQVGLDSLRGRVGVRTASIEELVKTEISYHRGALVALENLLNHPSK